MNDNLKVELGKVVKELMLEKLYYKDEFDKIPITTADINRPGLQLAGFFEYFGKRTGCRSLVKLK